MWLCGLSPALDSRPCILRSDSVAVAIDELSQASILGNRLEDLRGRSVLLATREQLSTALALIELDGVARRIVLCPADLAPTYASLAIHDAQTDALVSDAATLERFTLGDYAAEVPTVLIGGTLASYHAERRQSEVTEWVLMTSGTTGTPKLVLHTSESLTNALTRGPWPAATSVWSTFYDIRRYGGLQIFLRALRSAGLVLSAPAEPVDQFLIRARAAGVTHISGTPTHWRRAMMSGVAATISPDYVRLSGEIADQPILDTLHAVYPQARIEHAFASTEAGVGFAVGDGLAGFPAKMLLEPVGDPELRIIEGTLHVRGSGTATRYLGEQIPALRTSEAFVNTGDRLELKGGRYYFMGRSGGVINVGGLKVYPEEVETVINSHPRVRMSLVQARRSPITGAVVIAEVVPVDGMNSESGPREAALLAEIRELCQRALAAHKVPATIRCVTALEMSDSGKLVRSNA